MPSITTTGLRNSAALAFIDNMGVDNFVYMVLGRGVDWANEPSPDPPLDSVESFYSVWNHAYFGKLVTIANFSLVVPRYNWKFGEIYTAYTHTNTNLFNTQFYVINSNLEVYKCLANNQGRQSTVEPAGLGSPVSNYVQTSNDGYSWKYMLQVSDGDIFFNPQWFGVPSIAPINSTQATIVNAAVTGSIDHIHLVSGGQNFTNGVQQNIIQFVGDGTNAIAHVNVVGGIIQSINLVNKGNNYTTAQIVFTDPNGFGANAVPIISPPGGHGSQADLELAATTVMISVITANSEAGFLPITNSFRQESLILNPQVFGGGPVSTIPRVALYYTFTVSGGIGEYIIDEVVFQGNSINNPTFSGVVVDFDPLVGILKVNAFSGQPLLQGIIYGLSSNAQRYITNIVNPDAQKYSGSLLQLDNTSPIPRILNQEEQFQFIINF